MTFPASEWLVLTRNFVAGSHPQNDNLDHIGIVGRGLIAIGEKPELATLTILVQHVNGVLPGIELCGIEFAQVQHLALDHARPADAETFADGIISVRLAVFGARATFEKHNAAKLPRSGRVKTRG